MKRSQINHQKELLDIIARDRELSSRCRLRMVENNEIIKIKSNDKTHDNGSYFENFEIQEILEIILNIDQLIEKLQTDLVYSMQPQKNPTILKQIELLMLRRSELSAKYEFCSKNKLIVGNLLLNQAKDFISRHLICTENVEEFFFSTRNKWIVKMNDLNVKISEEIKLRNKQTDLIEELELLPIIIMTQVIIKSLVKRVSLDFELLLVRNNHEKCENVLNCEKKLIIIFIQTFARKYIVNKKMFQIFINENDALNRSLVRYKINDNKKQVKLSIQDIMEDLKWHKNKSPDVLHQTTIDFVNYMRKEAFHELGETLQEEIYQFFVEYRCSNGKFPLYPTKLEGGSSFWFNNIKTASQLKEEMIRGEKLQVDSSETQSDKNVSKNVELLSQVSQDYQESWNEIDKRIFDYYASILDSNYNIKISELQDDKLKYSININKIRKENREIVMKEIREKVDEDMRKILEDLRSSIDQEKQPKSKIQKKSKPSSSVGAQKAKDRKMREFNVLKASLEDQEICFKTLAYEGLIIVPDNNWPSLNDFNINQPHLDDFNLTIESRMTIESIVSYLKQQLVIPNRIIEIKKFMAMTELDQNLPIKHYSQIQIDCYWCLPKSFLLVGPKGIGKRYLIQSIAKDIKAIVIDLSCNRLTVDKFVGNDGMRDLMMNIKKLAINCSPIIILIENVDYLFRKKSVKLKDGTDTKRLKKELPKLMKFFEKNQSVYLFGTSEAPWESDQKQLLGLFDKKIAIGLPSLSQLKLYFKKHYNHISKMIDDETLDKLFKLCKGCTFNQLDLILRIMSVKIENCRDNLNTIKIKKIFAKILNQKKENKEMQIAIRCQEWLSNIVDSDPFK